MVAKITEGVKVTVETFYQPDYSNPLNSEYMFAYKITIENYSTHAVRLKRRHWHIYDTNGTLRDVEGEGVVGKQPLLNPGEAHHYVSGCNLRTDMGKMCGTYTMERISDGKLFEVNIPEFHLVAPFKLN